MCNEKQVHKFKVGDKGKTRGGKDYEIVLIDNRLRQPLRAILDKQTALTSFHHDGVYNETGIPCSLDLLPPSRTVYVNFYENGYCFYHDDEPSAMGAGIGQENCIAVAVPVKIQS